ncbi:MAG TPA: long-chain fatty acid--CoA ligase [Mycobacteriales bacterium]|nr:long-chain fatty acid--CoA ligase [Mycobacteriales bacterium]
MASLARLLSDTVARHGDRPAVRLDDTTLTYRQLDDAVARCAGMLRAAGVGEGDRVGIMLPNVPHFPIAYFAVLRLGGVVVPMNVLLKERETSFYLTDPGAKVVLPWKEFAAAAQTGADAAGAQCIVIDPATFPQLLAEAEPVREDVPREDDETAVILYTSGTTGTPKGAQLTHHNLYENARVTATTLFEFSETDVVLGALPLFHVFGQTCAMNASVFAGALLTMLPRFDPKQGMEVMQRDGVTVFEGVPTMFNGFLHLPERKEYDLSSLRVCCSGGAAMPVEVLKGFEQEFSCTVLEGYGLSETSPVCSFNHPHGVRKAGSIGTPIQGVEMKVADDDGTEVPEGEVGQIYVRGPNVMKGYWNKPEATAEAMKDGWFGTGDMARKDEDGLYFIVDRKKDLIIRGGYNVYPREIEEVLYEHPGILEAAVIGMPHPSLGEEVAAVVVAKEGGTLDVEEVKAFVKSQVAGYKYPRVVLLADALPKGPTGKILKRELSIPDDAQVGA